MSSEASTSSNTTAVTVGSSMQQQTRAEEKDVNDAEFQCLATLNSLGLEPGPQVAFNKEYATRGIVRNGDTQVKLSTNIFDLQTTACDVFHYHLEFEKVCETGRYAGKSFPFVDPNRRTYDYTTVKNRQQHGKLLSAFITKYPNVFGNDPDHFCYDCATTLYSLVELVPLETPMFLTKDETAAAINLPVKITLTVKKPENNVFNVRDLMKRKSLDLSKQPLHILRFLELATSRHASLHPEQYVMFDSNKTYFMRPEEHGFDVIDLKRGNYLAAGASKTVACIEGPKNKGVPAVVIESKKTPFFHSMKLLEMLCASANIRPEETVNGDQLLDLVSLVNHLEVFPLYGNRKRTSILLSGLTQSDANKTVIEYNGVKTSIAQYFFQRYGITMNYPHWPLAIGAKKVQGYKPYFPLELLVVAEFQRIGSANITSVDIANIVRACAVAPATKERDIFNCYQSFSFGIDPFMQKAGIGVAKEPLKVPARVLKAPQIRYANGTLNPESNGKWRLPKQAEYENGATLKRWLGIFLIVPNERMAFKEFVAFVQRFYEECGIRGLQIDEPYDLRQVVCDDENIEAAFCHARDENCEYILFGHSDRDNKYHSFIKGMERKYEVITQCVKTKTIYNVMEQSPVSLENIVAKANVKLGGLSHSVVLDDVHFDKNTLFVGLGINHPGVSNPHKETNPSVRAQPQTAGTAFPSNVSVLGFCANDGAVANEFIGNFFFSPVHRDEKLSVLDKLLEEVFERFHRNRQCAPTRIILFRSGCDEGKYRSVLKYEMPVITAICDKYAPGAPVSVIVPSKLHQVRFFKQNIDPQNRSDVQNIRPGTVVDGNVVSSAFCEYYLNSHVALQGTAKTPKYTILYSSEKEVNLDLFERLTNALCYEFQIVTSPTSIPAPLYIAQRYAERGRQIWNTFSYAFHFFYNVIFFSTSKDANLDGYISNMNGQNGLGAARSTSNSSNGNLSEADPNAAAFRQFFEKSIDFNFSKKQNLRDKRVNA